MSGLMAEKSYIIFVQVFKAHRTSAVSISEYVARISLKGSVYFS
jgi:hypothetical protein